jgi:LacI family transcriptional regulator
MKKSKSGPRGAARSQRPTRSPTLKQLAEHLGLSPATVSIAMNGGPNSGLAAETQRTIRKAAREMGYRPNYLARWLRTRKSCILGVIIPEVSQGYTVLVLRGLEDYLVGTEYFYFAASHHNRPELLEEYAYKFLDRAVDGLIVISAPWELQLDVPVVVVSSRQVAKGAIHVSIDHDYAAELGLRHLMELGHRRIAVMKGPDNIPDSEARWKAISAAASKLGLSIPAKLVRTIEPAIPSDPSLGYEVARKLLDSGESFTALWAFNDITALGAISAFQDRGLRVPQDVSVLGFDDIEAAGLQRPGLTTIRQPLAEMGRLAGEAMVAALAGKPPGPQLVVRPELVVRESTAAPSAEGTSVATEDAPARHSARR